MDTAMHRTAHRDSAAEVATRCLTRLVELAARDQIDVDAHLDDLRRCLARRHVPGAGARSRHVVAAVRSGGIGWTDDSPVLRRDLRGVEHTLDRTARIGAHLAD